MSIFELKNRVETGNPANVQRWMNRHPDRVDIQVDEAIKALYVSHLEPAMVIQMATKLLPHADDDRKADFLDDVVDHGHLELLTLILDKGWHPPADKCEKALVTALDKGDVASLQLLHRHTTHEVMFLALAAQAEINHQPLMEQLMKDPRTGADDRVRAIQAAARGNHPDSLRFLLTRSTREDGDLAAEGLVREHAQANQSRATESQREEALDTLALHAPVEQVKGWVKAYPAVPFARWWATQRQAQGEAVLPPSPARRRLRS